MRSGVYGQRPRHAATCRSRTGVWRLKHSLDRDGVCVFCDMKPPTARSRLMREARAAMVAAGRDGATRALEGNLGAEGDWFADMRERQRQRRNGAE